VKAPADAALVENATRLARRAATAPRHRYHQYRARQQVRSLAGARLLREFHRAHPRAFFVQVGSNDGEQHDPLRTTILRSRWRGIMIEPLPFVFERLQRNYGPLADRIALENVAIGEHDGSLPFFHLAPVDDHRVEGLPQWYDGIGSFKREHVLKHVDYIPDIAERLVCTDVRTLTFEALCERHHVERIDLLHIDAEGSDFDLIRTIDIERHRPRLLIYEHYHLSTSDQAACRRLLEGHDYETIEHGMDTWCLLQRDIEPRERRLMELWQAVKREDGASPSSLKRMVAGRPAVQRTARTAWRRLKRVVEGDRRTELEYWLDVMVGTLTPAEWRMFTEPYDDTVPLPAGADEALSPDSPRLAELRREYAASNLPVTVPSLWSEDLLGRQLDLRYFRGENPYVWHYREWPRSMALKYFVFTEYVRGRDQLGLFDRLDEDGAFGCWTFDYAGRGRVSRDLLDSINELNFLGRHLDAFAEPNLRVLDIGAGYGRTAHRMIGAAPNVVDYCCVDAIPESTFICEYHLAQRGCTPPARVVPLHRVESELLPHGFDLAVNIHSFSECTYAAVEWWVQLLDRLRVPNLFIIPNDEDELLALEPDHTRRDCAPLLEAAGYSLVADEPVIDDPAVQDLLQVTDHFLLFQRRL
jgi:FkbM family methyltransferase